MKNDLSTGQYKGVRGWLLFLCISMTILRPLAVMAAHGRNGEDIWHPNASMIFDLAVSCFSIYIGICLWRVRPKAITKARIYLWALTGLNVVIAMLIFVQPGASPHEQAFILTSCLKEILWCAVWLAYLKSSKRIKATYEEKMHRGDATPYGTMDITQLFWRVLPPYEVKVTRSAIRTLLSASDGLGSSGPIPVMQGICIEQIQREALLLTKDANRVVYSIRIDHMKPDQLALILIHNVLTRNLQSGCNHVYRGALSMIGRDMLRLWNITGREMVKRGYLPEEEYVTDASGLRQAISEVG